MDSRGRLVVFVMIFMMLGAVPDAPAQSFEFDVQRGLQYGQHDGVQLTADLYAPKAPGKYPALVAVHGGGWQAGNVGFYQHWGPYLAQRGYVLFAIGYRLVRRGTNTYPAAVHDVRAGIQFLRSRGEAIKVDPDRIGLIGDSAGAHLAALVALAGDKPPWCTGRSTISLRSFSALLSSRTAGCFSRRRRSRTRCATTTRRRFCSLGERRTISSIARRSQRLFCSL